MKRESPMLKAIFFDRAFSLPYNINITNIVINVDKER